jgi:hypothetical protein
LGLVSGDFFYEREMIFVKDAENDWQKYMNRKYQFSMRIPADWAKMTKESPTGETVILYHADKNLIRVIISNNEANKKFIGDLIASPFKTILLTDSGLHGRLSIGTGKNDKKRIIAWFYTESNGFTYHMVADMDIPFAIENKDILILIAKSFTLEKYT